MVWRTTAATAAAQTTAATAAAETTAATAVLKTIATTAAIGAALAALPAQAARPAFSELEPAQQDAACAALAQAGGGETIYVVSQPPASELIAVPVGGMLDGIVAGEIDFVATRVRSSDC